LLSHDCLCVGSGNRIYDRWEFEGEGKELEVQVKGPLIMNDSMHALAAALDGLGLVYSSEDAISDKVGDGRLELVLEPYASNSAGFYLYFPERSQVHPKLRAFIEHVRGHPGGVSP